MSVIASEYVRRVAAVQVTSENATLVAAWCGGVVRPSTHGLSVYSGELSAKKERRAVAFIGDWVVREGQSFKIYPKADFEAWFQPETKPDNYEPVLELVKDAMLKQDLATYSGHASHADIYADETARRIVTLFRQ